MRTSSPLSVTPLSVHIQRALLKPLPERCKELTQILRETSYKATSGHAAFSALLTSAQHEEGRDLLEVCGTCVEGWGLLAISSSQRPQDFESAYEFLAPEGPLLTMAYRLLGDGHTRYEFPVSCLPVGSQCLLEEGDIPLLYNNKVPYFGPGRPIAHVLLNPFEYYFFHFAYSILNPNHPKSGASACPDNLSDCLYIHLLETYLSSFLPLNPTPVSSVVSPSHQQTFRAQGYTSLPGSLAAFPGGHHQLSCLLVSSPSSRISVGSLLKRTPSFSLPSSSPSVTTTAALQEELWRAEFLVLALTEFWLGISPNIATTAFNSLFQGTFVPSFLHIHLVRLTIKHLHMFSSSTARNELLVDVSSAGQQSPWDMFKSQVIPQLVQRKLYTFLRLTFERWPLDASFRLPLETWLSYIQPWRYTDPKLKSKNPSEKQAESVCFKWQTFVIENLLFYSVLFKQLLPRFFRMELNSPKNSFLLFRVSKVFSQTNLQAMITEAEGLLQRTCSSQLTSTGQFLSPTAVNHLRQFVVETEGYNYQYTPMFGPQGRDTVLELLKLIVSAREMAIGHTLELKKSHQGWLPSIVDWLCGNEECQGGLTLTESKKVTLHLDMVLEKLCQMFQIPLPQIERSPNQTDISSGSLDHSFNKKWDFKEKLRPLSFREVHYRGNPDLQPIRSFEVAFLVRMLHHLSTTLNNQYQNEINGVYMRGDWLGSLSRQFLMPPVVFQDGVEDVSLPPRICFRALAHKKVLVYLFLFYVLFCVIGGHNLFSFFLVLMFLLLIYASVKAFIDRKRKLR